MGLPATTPIADPPGGQTPVSSLWAVARVAVLAPFTRRQRRELLFCLAGLPFAMVNPLVLFVLTVDLIWLVADSGRGNPTLGDLAIAGANTAGAGVTSYASMPLLPSRSSNTTFAPSVSDL